MKTKIKLIPKIKFGVNYFIQEQISNRNWADNILLEKLEISNEEFIKAIEKKDAIPAAFANKLSVVFSTSAEYWINIDKNYKSWKKDNNNNSLIK